MAENFWDFHQNIALAAQAGSGKTRALTLRFLNLYLKEQNLSSLYAITFTNKATLEMKQRIIRYLNLLSGSIPPEKDEEKLIIEDFKKRYSDITTRANKCKNILLNNLSDLNVSTIHSLLHGLLGTIPFEAGILPNFRIIEDAERNQIIDEVIDKFLEETWEDHQREIYEVLDPSRPDVKHTLREALFSLLFRLPEVDELLAEGKESLGEIKEKQKNILAFIEKDLQKLFSYLEEVKKSYELGKRLESKLSKLNEALKDRKGYVEESLDLIEKSYFLKVLEKHSCKKELERLVGALREKGRQYLLLNNHQLLLSHFNLLSALGDRFRRYKQENNLLTFDDLQYYASNVLSSRLDREYLYFKSSSQIQHLLIDEFQDTSVAQWHILNPIVEEILSSGEGSFFYVGDPRQAIYRFRGGEPALFSTVQASYPQRMSLKHLPQNYRSKGEIVNFINMLFSERDSSVPPMVAHQKSGGWIKVEDLGLYKQEEGARRTAEQVVNIIRFLTTAKGYNFSDIAILVRKNEAAIQLGEYLKSQNIPYLSESKANLTFAEEVRDILNLLRWLDNPEEDFYLSQVLLSPLFGLEDETLRQLRREEKTTLYYALQDNHPHWEVSKKLQNILNSVGFKTPYHLLSLIYSELKVRGKYNSPHALLQLLQTAYRLEVDNYYTLTSFLDYLDTYGQTLKISLKQLEGVKLLTCHKAKGLEFPVVILPETVWRMTDSENDWFVFEYESGEESFKLEDIYWRKDPSLKKIKGEIFEKEKERTYQDELNSLYVALTRAQEGIWLLGYRNEYIKNTWFDFITNCLKDQMKKGQYTQGEIEVVKTERLPQSAIYQKESKRKLVFSPQFPSEGKFSTPTEAEEVGLLPEDKTHLYQWGQIVHFALAQVNWLDDKNLEEVIAEAVKKTQANFASNKPEEQNLESKLTSLLQGVLSDRELDFIFFQRGRKVQCSNELPIYFRQKNREVSGKLDRLLLEKDLGTIIDYKTGPTKEEYSQQIKSYLQGIGKIYPERKVKAYLVFVDNPPGEKLQELTQSNG